jgi:hypothetical protein
MTTEIEEILVQAIGRLGGAGFVSRRLPSDIGDEVFELFREREELEPVVAQLLAAAGKILVLNGPGLEKSQSALVGSGFLRLNPAVVTVWLTPVASGRTKVRVHGIAKEGLIKQRGGQQVAREFALRLQQSVAGT